LGHEQTVWGVVVSFDVVGLGVVFGQQDFPSSASHFDDLQEEA
jgi:hypothetical protein